MFYNRLIFFLILLFHLALPAGSNDEFRATWVITWEQIDSNWPRQNEDRIWEILNNHERANMNAVLWQVRQNGTGYYNSSYEPWGKYLNYTNPGYDPLAYAIQEAHIRGLELHAWMNVFECRGAGYGTPAEKHPKWICRDQNGNPMPSNITSLSPGLAEVRHYLVNVAMEIVRNYDIDGLHLDYVRWNEYTNPERSQELAELIAGGMTLEEQTRELIENKAGRYLYDTLHPYSAGVPEGFESWEEWWRWSVTEFVRVLHDSIQAVKPWVRLSAAALGKYNWSGWQAYDRVYQDAALWFNEGYVDQLMPMHYHWTDPQDFYNMLSGGYQCWSPYIQDGVADGRLYTVGFGSYKFAIQGVWENHAAVVEACRSVPWVDGFQFFSYRWWDEHNYWDEAGETFFNQKTKVRGIKLIDSIPPDPPTISLYKIDSLTYEIAVIPPITATSNYWYAIYRSTDSIIDIDNDEIIDIHFGDSPFTYIDNFDGIQNYNGVYSYAATAFDRYWNESEISNIVQSDSIPSFPPTGVSTVSTESGFDIHK